MIPRFCGCVSFCIDIPLRDVRETHLPSSRLLEGELRLRGQQPHAVLRGHCKNKGSFF